MTQISAGADPSITNDYERAYQWLFPRQTKELQAKILAAVNSDCIPPKDVSDFYKRVIAMAETGS